MPGEVYLPQNIVSLNTEDAILTADEKNLYTCWLKWADKPISMIHETNFIRSLSGVCLCVYIIRSAEVLLILRLVLTVFFFPIQVPTSSIFSNQLRNSGRLLLFAFYNF